jgi:GxxExxY protein
MAIYYDGLEIGTRRVDFFVAYKIMVELKAVIRLDDTHIAQCRNYLEAYNLPVGLLYCKRHRLVHL